MINRESGVTEGFVKKRFDAEAGSRREFLTTVSSVEISLNFEYRKTFRRSNDFYFYSLIIIEFPHILAYRLYNKCGNKIYIRIFVQIRSMSFYKL